MKSVLGLVALNVIFCVPACAENFPYNPIPLADYTAEGGTTDTARLKISVAPEDGGVLPKLKFGGIVICSKTACYRPKVDPIVESGLKGNGNAKLVADARIPYGQIDKLYFEDFRGANVTGVIKLSRPLNLEKGYFGGEIFVTLKPLGMRQVSTYSPSFATSNFLREGGQSIYYNPRLPLNFALSHGVFLKIPSGALDNPEIFNVQVNDTGEQFPMVDIFPYLTLKKNGTVSVKALQRAMKTQNRPSVPVVPPPPSASGNRASVQNMNPSQVERSISKTGLLKNSHFSNNPQTSVNAGSATPSAVPPMDTQCADLMRVPENLQVIKDSASVMGITYINWCMNIPPFVHIMYVNAADMRIKFNLRYDIQIWPSTGLPATRLQKLTSLVPYGQGVGMNGFYWQGDLGYFYPQYGLPMGYVASNGTILGDNRVGGGAAQTGGVPASAGHKSLMVFGANSPNMEYAAEASDVGLSSRGTVISSSTTVFKYNYLCSSDTDNDRWSAIGVGSGAMILVSSTSDGSTSAAELCPLFRAFGSHTALRMDGGSAAGLVNDGYHLNPLTGPKSFIFGSARHLSYALRLGW